MEIQSSDDQRWDLQSALASVDGEVAELKHLLEIWVRMTPKLMGEIRSGLENEEPERLHLAAHKLKGSLQILCAEDFCSSLIELEKAGREGRTKGLEKFNEILEVQMASLNRHITEFLESVESGRIG